MRKIELGGKTYDLACNMKALVSYQRVSGANPLDIEHMTDDQRIMFDVTMGWCMLEASNEDVPSIEEMMTLIDSVQKQAAFSTAVAEELTRYYGLLPGDNDTADRNENENENQEEDEGKYEKKD